MKNPSSSTRIDSWRWSVGAAGAVCLLVALASFAADPEPAASSAAAAVQPGDEQARYLAISKREIELQTQLRVLTELSQLHTGRGEAAQRANRQDLAGWERELSREMSDRAAQTLTQLASVTRERAGMEDAKLVVVPLAASLSRTNTVNPEEAAYLAKLHERMLATEQELTGLANLGRQFVAELQTNTLPQDIERISLQLEGNGREVRQVQKEMSDLELRRLEFRAARSSR